MRFKNFFLLLFVFYLFLSLITINYSYHSSYSKPISISSVDKHTFLHNRISERHEIDMYSFFLKEPKNVTIKLYTPKKKHLRLFSPDIYLIGPKRSRINSFFLVPKYYGAQQGKTMTSERVIFDSLSQTQLFEKKIIRSELFLPGTYFIAVAAPTFKRGPYIVEIYSDNANINTNPIYLLHHWLWMKFHYWWPF